MNNKNRFYNYLVSSILINFTITVNIYADLKIETVTDKYAIYNKNYNLKISGETIWDFSTPTIWRHQPEGWTDYSQNPVQNKYRVNEKGYLEIITKGETCERLKCGTQDEYGYGTYI